MKALATVLGVLATALLAGLVAADVARAGRLDVAGRALREPGVWVDHDLRWLVSPARARRLDRAIDRARLPVRVAVLPQVAVDESRGDQLAIVRAIMRRTSRDGLYVLVDQDGGLAYAARSLPLDVSEGSFRTRKGFDAPSTLDEVLDAIVPTLRAAKAATPVSFEPYANPQGVVTHYPRDGDSLLGIAAGTLLLGAMLGFALYGFMRAGAGIVELVRRRRHA